MNRTDGLVRRAVKPRENGAEGGGTGGLNANTPDDNQDPNDTNKDHEDNIDDGDSKETRLTLMEEVLLLGLKDKEVRAKKKVCSLTDKARSTQFISSSSNTPFRLLTIIVYL